MDTISERTRRWLRLLLAFLMALLLVEAVTTSGQAAESSAFRVEAEAQAQVEEERSGVGG